MQVRLVWVSGYHSFPKWAIEYWLQYNMVTIQYSVIRCCEFLSGVIALYTNVLLARTCPPITRVSWFGKYLQANTFFTCVSCCKKLFCVSVFQQTLFFLLAYNLFQNFPYLSIPIIVHFRISSIGLFVNLLTIVTFSFFFFSDIWIVVYFSQRSSKNYLSISFRISRSLLWTPILNSILLFVPKPLAPWPS